MKFRTLAGVVLLILLSVSFAGAVERTHNIVPEDYFTQIFISDIAASPDGSKTAFVDYRWDEESDGRFRDVYVVDNKSHALQRLTFEPSNDHSPQWSPDGKTIYYMAHTKQGDSDEPPYDGSAQVWRVNVDGSDLMPITRVPDGIVEFDLSDDGKILYYTRAREEIGEEFHDLLSQYNGKLKFGHGIYEVTELYKLDLTTWRTDKVCDPGRNIAAFAVSPSQNMVAMITTPDEHNISHEGWSDVRVLDLSSHTLSILPDKLWREEAPSPYGWLENLTWADNGNKLAFSIDFDGYPAELFVADLANGAENATIQRLPRPEGVSAMGSLAFLPGGKALAFIGDEKARSRVYAINITSGTSSTLTPGDVVIDGFDFVGSRGDLTTIQSELTYYQDIVLWKKGRSERITHLNPQVDSWILPQISIYKWVGAEGDTVEGILELPADYDGSSKLPLLVNIHGGPTDSEKYCFLFWIYGRASFPAKGYAMLAPNYRGSTGYGDKFMTDLVGNENDYDVQDIMSGVDALIADGIVDPERLGVSGWSNGGYLTNALISTNRFKAASSGAGVLDMTVQFLEEDTPGHVLNFQEGFPWDNPKEYQDASPLYSLKPGLQTAVLIHVGENDPRVPASHSKGLHRVLYRYLNMPTELVIYPGAGHNLTKKSHRLAKVRWDQAWFDKYLLGQ